MIYDDNQISIEGDTKIAFSEDVQARYDAYGWDTHHVDFTNGFTTYEEKVAELYEVIEKAKATPTGHTHQGDHHHWLAAPDQAGDHKASTARSWVRRRSPG